MVQIGNYCLKHLMQCNGNTPVQLFAMPTTFGKFLEILVFTLDWFWHFESILHDSLKSTILTMNHSAFYLTLALMERGKILQVVEIGKGSKVKYELDKKTGLIKVLDLWSIIFIGHWSHSNYGFLKVHICAGWSCSLLVCCVPSQLWLHPSHSLWG